MRRFSLLLLGAALVGCTGENVDESFLATHGAVLARVDCVPTGRLYSAKMFLDGSVFVSGTGVASFYERSESQRANAPLIISPVQSECAGNGGIGSQFLIIEDGDLNFYQCEGSPSAPVLQSALDIDTQCTGFNKHLFD